MQSTIFSKDNLKGITPELQEQIIQRFNDYDTLIRVMKTVANNLQTLLDTTNGMDYNDRQDVKELSKLLNEATNPEWLKTNHLYF